MKYLNLSSCLNQHESMLRSTPEQKGIWFDLVSYCHQQMNSGMIVDCADWPDTMWQRVAGITGPFMRLECPLWHWSGAGILIVHHYDAHAEEIYKRKQMLGRRYAQQRWEAAHTKKIVRIVPSNHGKPQKDNAS